MNSETQALTPRRFMAKLNVRGFANRLFLVGISLSASLLFAEILLRLFWPQQTGPVQFAYDPVRGGIPVPGQHGRRIFPGVYDYTYTNNSLGLRGPEIGQKKGQRILLLGDSFTYGIGVNDDQTFAVQLERLTGIEVVNAGNGGTGTDYALRFYETIGHTLQSDIVILCFFANDFLDNERGTYYDSDLKPRDLSKSVYARKGFLNSRGYNWLIEHSHLANLIKQAFVRWSGSGVIDDSQTHVVNIGLTQKYLSLLRQKVEQEGAKFDVFYVPSAEDIQNYRNGKESDTEHALKTIENEVSLTPALANSGYDVRFLYFSEGHWQPAAHKLAAQAITQKITLGKEINHTVLNLR